MSRRLGSSTARVAALAALAGCGAEEPTEIVAAVTTQMQVPDELEVVGVAVQSGGRLVHCLYYPVDDGTVSLPSTLGMAPSGDPSVPVTVTVLGFRAAPPPQAWDCLTGLPDVGEDNVSVLRRRRMPYAEKRVVLLPMPLKHACTDVGCGEGLTCVGGACQAADLDPGALLDYADEHVYGQANTCFSASECTAGWTLAPAFVADPGNCTFELPQPDPPVLPFVGLNVVLLHDNLTPEVLDLDPLEGFTIPDPARPWRFQLAPSLCQSRYAHGDVAAVFASALCPSKTPGQPICSADQQAILEGTSGLPGAPVCHVGARLEPTASALYVVMDRSAAMASYFGAQGLDAVLELSLQDPVFARTLVAFKLAPAETTECGLPSNAYASPAAPADVPFLLAAEARDLVAQKVSDPSNVLPSDPPVLWDVVMSPGGAYAALGSVAPPSPSQSFNQRGLLLIGNRDFYSRCSVPAATLPALATAAAQGQPPIRTYTVVVGADPGVDQGGHDPVADAAAIALAGNGRAFDATSDPVAGATALLTIANDFGTCLYDPPATAIPTSARLSYWNPLWLVRTDIAHAPGCVDETSFDSGWNTDAQGRIRICGGACTALRSDLQQLSGAAAAAGLNAPIVPLRVTEDCPL
ncbi:MAG: hypothetical protein HY908_28735 [Myxococcales bacterium]|nr:hypothetical protein [Myxococcales bacterium]